MQSQGCARSGPVRRARATAASSDVLGAGQHVTLRWPAKRASPGLGVSPAPLSRCPGARWPGTSIWYLAMTASASAQVVASAAAWGRSRSGKKNFFLSGHRREYRKSAGSPRAPAPGQRQPAALERGEVRARSSSRRCSRRCGSALLTACLSSNVQARRRRWRATPSRRRKSSKVRGHRRSVLASAFDHAAGRRAGRRASGTGWAASTHLDAPAVGAMAVARDHQPRQLTLPVRLHGLRHRGGSLARANHHGAALRRRRQVRRQAWAALTDATAVSNEVVQQRARGGDRGNQGGCPVAGATAGRRWRRWQACGVRKARQDPGTGPGRVKGEMLTSRFCGSHGST